MFATVTIEIDGLEGILDGDFVVGLAQVTPLRGVVVSPVNSAGWDAETSTFSFTSDLAAFKKLRRLERNPQVAVVFHTREHGTAEGGEYVLVQGDASFSWYPDREALAPFYERPGTALGPENLGGVFWDWWLGPFWWERIVVRVHAQRVIAFPDAECSGPASVFGSAEPSAEPEPQQPPAKGTEPRVDVDSTARALRKLEHRLLGWVGADGYPVVVPVQIGATESRGMTLTAPAGSVPDHGRRAGLTGHTFTAGTLGQRQTALTGWLEKDGKTLYYAPHTQLTYMIPPSRAVWRVVMGAVTRIGHERARRDGVPSLPTRNIRLRLITPVQRYIANPVGRRVARYLNSQAVLETTGRKSGQPRTTPIGGRQVGLSYWIVSEFGRKSQYVRNIEANPHVRLQIRGVWHTGVAVLLDEDDSRRRLRELPWLNSALVRLAGSDLLTIRVDLD